MKHRLVGDEFAPVRFEIEWVVMAECAVSEHELLLDFVEIVFIPNQDGAFAASGRQQSAVRRSVDNNRFAAHEKSVLFQVGLDSFSFVPNRDDAAEIFFVIEQWLGVCSESEIVLRLVNAGVKAAIFVGFGQGVPIDLGCDARRVVAKHNDSAGWYSHSSSLLMIDFAYQRYCGYITTIFRDLSSNLPIAFPGQAHGEKVAKKKTSDNGQYVDIVADG